MTHVEILDPARDRAGGYKVDVSRGERIGRVSSEWFSRPADERYLSLSDLYAVVHGRTERSRTRTVESAAIRVEASRDDAERLELMLPGSDAPIAPTHWSFGQLGGLVGAPAAYLRQLPAPLAGINLHGLTSHRAEQVKLPEIEDGRIELRAVTVPDYGASTTTSWSPPCSKSPAAARSTRAGRCPACWTGRPAYTTPVSTSPSRRNWFRTRNPTVRRMIRVGRPYGPCATGAPRPRPSQSGGGAGLAEICDYAWHRGRKHCLPFVAKIGPCQQSFAEVTASPNRSVADKRFHQASRRRRSSF